MSENDPKQQEKGIENKGNIMLCKFRCESQTAFHTGSEMRYAYIFTPVYSNDPNSENKTFWDATPSGRLEIGGIRQNTFEPGKEYYITISESKK